MFKIKVGVKFYITSFYITRLGAAGIQKWSFGHPKIQKRNQIQFFFFKSGQNWRVDWIWSNVHYLHKLFFMCDSQFLRYDQFCIFFTGLSRNLNSYILGGLSIMLEWPISFSAEYPAFFEAKLAWSVTSLVGHLLSYKTVRPQRKKEESLVTKASLLKESLSIPE